MMFLEGPLMRTHTQRDKSLTDLDNRRHLSLHMYTAKRAIDRVDTPIDTILVHSHPKD